MIAGYDYRDSTSMSIAVPDYTAALNGDVSDFVDPRVSAALKKRFRQQEDAKPRKELSSSMSRKRNVTSFPRKRESR